MQQQGLDKKVDWNQRAHGEIAMLNEKVGSSINSSKHVLEGFAETVVSQLKLGREKLKNVSKTEAQQEPQQVSREQTPHEKTDGRIHRDDEETRIVAGDRQEA